MLFNTLEYALFLPAIVGLYVLLPAKRRWIALLVASYVFYMSWNWKYGFLLLFSTLIDYVAALGIGRTKNLARRRIWLLFSMVSNLGTLFLFKYFNFFARSINELAHWAQTPWEVPLHALILPVGISFYTFQTMSYTIDVYRGHLKPERNFGLFALYVTYFPQLVAGPIERSTRLLPQLREMPLPSVHQLQSGLGLILLGLFKKSVIADQLAPYVNEIFARPELYSSASAALGIFFFALQIYGDFSGYSDIAVGSSRLFGIELMLNFRTPYFATSIADFWQRWHISLSTWFRDYLYIPLGGNRSSNLLTLRNIAITFLISGLWHGDNWTFLCWGAFHGGLLIISRITEPFRMDFWRAIPFRQDGPLVTIARRILTFSLVCTGWTFFRADSLSEALFLLNRVTLNWSGGLSMALGVFPRTELIAAFASIVLLFFVELLWHSPQRLERWRRLPALVRFAVIQAAVVWIFLFGVFSKQEFIYFQF